MNNSQKAPMTLVELINYFSTKNTANEYLEFQIYEMGRGIKQIDKQLFNDFEAAKTPWPYPFIKSAWFVLFFSSEKDNSDFNLWFLKFPLDEQGLLEQSARDAYIKQFYEQVLLQQSKSEQVKTTPPTIEEENPYTFKPSEEKMANINAIIKNRLNLLPSKHYQDILHYIYNSEQKIDAWKNLGYQGLADLSCYMHNQYQNKVIEEELTQKIDQLPIEMLKALSTCLEHHQLSKSLVARISTLAKQKDQLDYMIACLRSISASSDNNAINSLLKQALQSEYRGNIELLAVVCGRCWDNLKEPWLMILFLEALAVNSSGPQAFNIMVSDLLFIPGMRNILLEQLRDSERSSELTIAIGNFYSSR